MPAKLRVYSKTSGQIVRGARHEDVRHCTTIIADHPP